MEKKIVVLKPITWNNSGYLRPKGIEKSGTDYVAKHGFGHEEWNGNPKRIWKKQRVFTLSEPQGFKNMATGAILG